MLCTFVEVGSSNFMTFATFDYHTMVFFNLRPVGRGDFAPWLFEDNSKTKRSSQCKLKIVFFRSILFLVFFFSLGNIRSRHQVESSDLASKKV